MDFREILQEFLPPETASNLDLWLWFVLLKLTTLRRYSLTSCVVAAISHLMFRCCFVHVAPCSWSHHTPHAVQVYKHRRSVQFPLSPVGFWLLRGPPWADLKSSWASGDVTTTSLCYWHCQVKVYFGFLSLCVSGYRKIISGHSRSRPGCHEEFLFWYITSPQWMSLQEKSVSALFGTILPIRSCVQDFKTILKHDLCPHCKQSMPLTRLCNSIVASWY